MNRLRDFLTGRSTDNNDKDSSAYRNGNNHNRQNNRPSHFSSRSRRYNDNEDLYLSDDEDDWGMSAFSATQSSLRYTDNNNYGSRSGNDGGGGRRSSSAFWDQSSINNDNNIGLTDSDIDMAGLGGGIRGEMEMPPSSTRATRGLQEWEREAIARDSLSDAFEIGDDDYYHSDHRRGSSSSSHHDTTRSAGSISSRPRQQPHVGHHTPLKEENTTAYDEVQEDIRSLERVKMIIYPRHHRTKMRLPMPIVII